MEPGIYAGLIYVVLHIIKKAVKPDSFFYMTRTGFEPVLPP